RFWTLKSLQRLCGHLNFAALAVPYAMLNTRLLQRAQRAFPKRWPRLLRPAVQTAFPDLHWWVSHLESSGVLFPSPPTLFLTTDASLQGWGACYAGRSFSGRWKGVWQEAHINLLELLTVYKMLQRLAPFSPEQHLMVQSDSSTVVALVNRQGTPRSLCL